MFCLFGEHWSWTLILWEEETTFQIPFYNRSASVLMLVPLLIARRLIWSRTWSVLTAFTSWHLKLEFFHGMVLFRKARPLSDCFSGTQMQPRFQFTWKDSYRVRHVMSSTTVPPFSSWSIYLAVHKPSHQLKCCQILCCWHVTSLSN